MRFKCLIVVMSLILSLVSGCSFESETIESQDTEQLIVYTSIYPLYDVAAKIAGDKSDVKLLVSPGTEVHSYEPTPREIADLESADIFFYNGLDLEPWADKIVNNLEGEGITSINFSVSSGMELIEFGQVDHYHGQEINSDHNIHHGNYDPHLWLDPMNMKSIAKRVKEEFIILDPDNQGVYQSNYEQFIDKINALDQEYKKILANRKQDYILVSHAAFGYLAHRYDLEQLAVAGISPHQEPSPRVLADLTKEAEHHGLEFIFMETIANPKTAETLAAEADLRVLTLHTIGSLTVEEMNEGQDYFSLMRENLSNLEKALVN